jgi:hypothetical protein
MFASFRRGLASPIACAAAISTTAILTRPSLKCTPTFNGVPVAAPFIMNKAYPIFDKAFPGLEMSGVFVNDHKEFSFEETGMYEDAKV